MGIAALHPSYGLSGSEAAKKPAAKLAAREAR